MHADIKEKAAKFDKPKHDLDLWRNIFHKTSGIFYARSPDGSAGDSLSFLG